MQLACRKYYLKLISNPTRMLLETCFEAHPHPISLSLSPKTLPRSPKTLLSLSSSTSGNYTFSLYQ